MSTVWKRDTKFACGARPRFPSWYYLHAYFDKYVFRKKISQGHTGKPIAVVLSPSVV